MRPYAGWVLLCCGLFPVSAWGQYEVGAGNRPAAPQGMLAPAQTAPVDVLFFSIAQCAPCQKVKPIVAQLQAQGLPFRTMDVDHNPQIALDYGVERFPTFLLVREGRILDRLEGAASVDRLVAFWEAAGPVASTVMSDVGQQQLIRDSQVLPAGYVSPSMMAPPREMELTASPVISAPANERDLNDPHHGWKDHIGWVSAPSWDAAHRRALAATVRIWVEESQSRAVGSGTVIDQKGEDVLILTCGHLFREAGQQAQIEIEIGFPDAPRKVPGMVLAFDSENHDIGLVVARVGAPVTVAPMARPDLRVTAGDPVFSIGCDGGEAPTVFRTRIKALTHYEAAVKFDTFGRPAQGRSGGGLFTAGGQLIGVCNAAAVEVDEGIFAGPESLVGILQSQGLDGLIQSPAHLAQADPRLQESAGMAVATSESSVDAAGPTNQIASFTRDERTRELVVVEQIAGDPNRTRTLVIRDEDGSKLRQLEAWAAESRGAVAATDNRGGAGVGVASEPWRAISREGEVLRGQSPR